MTRPPGGVPPPEKEAAAPAGTGAADETKDKFKPSNNNTPQPPSLLEMAEATARSGHLACFLPKQPAWCRQIGGDVLSAIEAGDEIGKLQRQRLQFAYDIALRAGEGIEIGPAYPGSTHRSVDEARRALGAMFGQILKETLAYHASQTQLAA